MPMNDDSAQSLAVRLREADAEELLRLLKKHLQELDVPELRQVLRNPFLTRQAVELLLEERRLTRIDLPALSARIARWRHRIDPNKK